MFEEVALAGELRRILDDGLSAPSTSRSSTSTPGRSSATRRSRAGRRARRWSARPAVLDLRAGRVVEELDWACRAAALRGALAAGLRKSLFVNVEPSLLDAPVPDHVAELLRARATSSTSCSS